MKRQREESPYAEAKRQRLSSAQEVGTVEKELFILGDTTKRENEQTRKPCQLSIATGEGVVLGDVQTIRQIAASQAHFLILCGKQKLYAGGRAPFDNAYMYSHRSIFEANISGLIPAEREIVKIGCGEYFVVLLLDDSSYWILQRYYSSNSKNHFVIPDKTIVDLTCQYDKAFLLTDDNWLIFDDQPRYQFKSPVKKMSSGAYHSAFLLANGELMGIATNTTNMKLNEFGLNSVDAIPKTIELPTKSTVIDVSCGKHHTLVLTDQFKVFAAGYSAYGQLMFHSGFTFLEIKPSSQRITRIFAAGHRSFFVTNNNSILACGKNVYQKFGLETKNQEIHTPIQLHIDERFFNSAWETEYIVGGEHSIFIQMKRNGKTVFSAKISRNGGRLSSTNLGFYDIKLVAQ